MVNFIYQRELLLDPLFLFCLSFFLGLFFAAELWLRGVPSRVRRFLLFLGYEVTSLSLLMLELLIEQAILG